MPTIATQRISVLISEPGAPGSTFLPYVWAVLKSYWERHGTTPDAVQWLDPIFRRDTIPFALDEQYSAPPDVLGLSCYTWNWEVNCEVARWAKARNPDCLVVAGGPDPDYKDPLFFEKHPYIDAVVVKDGEIPFTRILETMLSGNRELREIPGLYLPADPSQPPATEGVAHWFTGKAVVPTEFDHSPYADQFDALSRFAKVLAGNTIAATLETTRGCPYTCNYCDWGSSTMSKVRRFDQRRVEQDMECVAKLGVAWIFLADANFGILPRDLELADYLAEVRAKYGLPAFMYYSTAKNNPDRTVEITQKLYKADLIREHWLAAQHTDAEVLRVANRSNIAPAKYKEVATELRKLDIPAFVQLIIGMPGDTVDKWKTCLATLMEWGVHDHYQIAPYCLLPNAPAADPAFLREWNVQTMDREMIDAYGLRRKDNKDLTYSKLVVAFNGYTKHDWAESMTYSAFVQALHNMALTRHAALYLRFSFDVSFDEFYRAVIDGLLATDASWRDMFAKVRTVYEALLNDRHASDDMAFDRLPNFEFYIGPKFWVYAQLIERLTEFYDTLGKFLERRFPQTRDVASVLQYSAGLVLTPDRYVTRTSTFRIDRDWPAYFAALTDSGESGQRPAPPAFRFARTAIATGQLTRHETRSGKGPTDTPEKLWTNWLQYVIDKPCTASGFLLVPPVIQSRFQLPAFMRAGAAS